MCQFQSTEAECVGQVRSPAERHEKKEEKKMKIFFFFHSAGRHLVVAAFLKITNDGEVNQCSVLH